MTKNKPANKGKKKLRPDANEIAHRVMREATGQAEKTVPPCERSEDEKDPEAVARGAKGGRKGGKTRAETLSDEELSRAATIAATARWRKKSSS